MQELLDYHFEKTLLEKKCEKCNANQSEAHHQLSILPRFLIIHVKRFHVYKFKNDDFRISKLQYRVDIPLDISLGIHF